MLKSLLCAPLWSFLWGVLVGLSLRGWGRRSLLLRFYEVMYEVRLLCRLGKGIWNSPLLSKEFLGPRTKWSSPRAAGRLRAAPAVQLRSELARFDLGARSHYKLALCGCGGGPLLQ